MSSARACIFRVSCTRHIRDGSITATTSGRSATLAPRAARSAAASVDGYARKGSPRQPWRKHEKAGHNSDAAPAPFQPLHSTHTGGDRSQREGGRQGGRGGRGGGRRYMEKQDFFAPVGWKAVGAAPLVIDALRSLGMERPSHVQAEAYDALLQGAKHVVIADHAGSGKTLAYLLPFIQGMKQEEEVLDVGQLTTPNSPRLVVVCPTEELCQQVLMVCRALSKGGVKVSSRAMTGGHKFQTQVGSLREGVDIAICTPGRLRQLMEGRHLDLTYCKAVILDEVDVLLGDQGAFNAEVMPIAQAAGHDTRLVFVTATLPESVFMTLREEFPGIAAAVGPNLHKIATGVTEQLVDCSGGEDLTLEGGTKRKLAALWAVLQRHQVARTIVFCNKIDTCRAVENFLARSDRNAQGLVVVPLHAAIRADMRQANIRDFMTPPQAGQPRKVLVCTDRASRGLDSAYVEHVVLFDFPRDPSEYVRRVGRTARGAAGTGTVSVLVMGRQVKLAQEIIDRNQKGIPVHTVPAIDDRNVETMDFMRAQGL